MMGTGALSAKPSVASMCTECGACLSHCPQKIDIPNELKKLRKELEGPFFKPMMALGRLFMR